MHGRHQVTGMNVRRTVIDARLEPGENAPSVGLAGPAPGDTADLGATINLD
jgi:hypothetical protein